MEEKSVQNNWKTYLIPITFLIMLVDFALSIAVIAKLGNFIFL